MIYYGSINNNKCFSVDLVNWIGGLAMSVLNRSIEFNSILPSVRCSHSLSLCPSRFPLVRHSIVFWWHCVCRALAVVRLYRHLARTTIAILWNRPEIVVLHFCSLAPSPFPSINPLSYVRSQYFGLLHGCHQFTTGSIGGRQNSAHYEKWKWGEKCLCVCVISG